jgi:membrane protease YdiL (CAAX protease family)
VPPPEETMDRSGPFTDLALTLPLFVGYHLGVIFLPYRNAADWVTGELQGLADNSMLHYGLLTLAIGAAYVVPLLLAGRGKHIGWQRFAWIGGEGVVYAVGMRIVAGLAAARLFDWVTPAEGRTGLLRAAPALSSAVERASEALDLGSRATGAIMSLGAGFYEELAFRAVLYGGGVALLLFLFNITRAVQKFFVRLVWALVAAVAFSAWHHFGSMGETFELKTFSFRTLCGLVFTLIYQFRGLAPAVWTHALYDLWVLAT